MDSDVGQMFMATGTTVEDTPCIYTVWLIREETHNGTLVYVNFCRREHPLVFGIPSLELTSPRFWAATATEFLWICTATLTEPNKRD